MGRGLSNLQKDILRIVYEHRSQRDFEKEKQMQRDPLLRALRGGKELPPYNFRNYSDISNAKLIGALYDWPVYNWWARYEAQGRRPSEGGQVRNHLHNFRRSEVGAEEYNRRTASYYRSVGRLKERGLLEDHRHGLLITDEGIKVAEGLSVSNGRAP